MAIFDDLDTIIIIVFIVIIVIIVFELNCLAESA